jgi:hypothetical protein
LPRELGTKAEGSVAGTSTNMLADVAGLAASGAIEVPIVAMYPFDQV